MARILGVCLIILSVLGGQVFATNTDWAQVQALATGERIQVHVTDRKPVSGKVDRVTAESVFVLRSDKVIEVKRMEVRRVYVKTRGKWMQSTLIGAALGAGAGGGIGAGIMEKESGYAAAVAGTVVLFAAIGAVAGYALRSGKSVLVYQAP